jgi:PIN domain
VKGDVESMNTVLDNLKNESQRLRSLFEQLKSQSSMIRADPHFDDDIIWMGPDCYWTALSDEGRQIQARALEEYRKFNAIVRVLLREQPTDTLGRLQELDETILHVIQQDEGSFDEDAFQHFESAYKALDLQLDLLNRLHGTSNNAVLFVPDTNALLYNPNLEAWRFDDVPTFMLVFTPPVLSELDQLKVNHRVENVRENAEKVIKQIKEYRRRAVSSGKRLSDGVVLVKGVSSILAIATEPDMGNSLPWLQAENNDDRLLAGAIEVMRLFPRSPVILVTRDINLQNKAEFANVSFVEPPTA